MSRHQTEKRKQKGTPAHSEPPVLLKIVKSRVFLIVVALLAFYTTIGFFLAPYLVERYVPQILQKNLLCKAGIGKVRINPFLFTFEANDFSISETNGTPVG